MDEKESIKNNQTNSQEISETASTENKQNKSSVSFSFLGLDFTIIIEEAFKWINFLFKLFIQHPITSIIIISLTLTGGIASCIHQQQIKKFDTAYTFLWSGHPEDAQTLLQSIVPFEYSTYHSDAIRSALTNACFYKYPLDNCRMKMDKTPSPWQEIIIARSLYFKGKLNDAFEHYQNVITQNISDSNLLTIDAYLGQALCLYRQAQNRLELDKVKKFLDHVLSYSNCGMAHILDGLVHMDQLEFHDAYEKFLAADVYVNQSNEPLENQPLARINAMLKDEMSRITDFFDENIDVQYKKAINDPQFSPEWLMLPLKPLANYSPWIGEELDLSMRIQQRIQRQQKHDPCFILSTYYTLKNKSHRFFSRQEIKNMAKKLKVKYLIHGTFQYTQKHEIKVNLYFNHVYQEHWRKNQIVITDTDSQSIVEQSASWLNQLMNNHE